MATFVISTVRCTLSPLSLTQCSVNDIFRAETIRTLNRRTVKVMTIIFPASINEIIKNKTYRIDSVGMSVSKVLLFEDMVLKIQPENEETQNEHLMMEWLDGKLPVPKVICHEIQDGMDLFADDTYLRQNVLRRRIFARFRQSGADTGIRFNEIMEHRYFRLPLQYESGPEIKNGRIQCKKSSGRYG